MKVEDDPVPAQPPRPAEADDGAAAVALAVLRERDGTCARLGRVAPAPEGPVLLRLHHVGEIGGEGELDPHALLLVGVVGHDQVLVDALRHEPVAGDGQRRLVLVLSRADDSCREVVDDPAGERSERLSVNGQGPAREVAHVLVEEALGLALRDVAVRRGVEERRAVDEDQLLGHDPFGTRAGRSLRSAHGRPRPDRPGALERLPDGVGGLVGARARLPALGDRAGLGAAARDGAAARRTRAALAGPRDRLRRGLVVVQLRGGGDRQVDVPEGREPAGGDGLPVRLDQPRLRDRHRDLDLHRLAVHAGRVRRRTDPDLPDVARIAAARLTAHGGARPGARARR